MDVEGWRSEKLLNVCSFSVPTISAVGMLLLYWEVTPQVGEAGVPLVFHVFMFILLFFVLTSHSV